MLVKVLGISSYGQNYSSWQVRAASYVYEWHQYDAWSEVTLTGRCAIPKMKSKNPAWTFLRQLHDLSKMALPIDLHCVVPPKVLFENGQKVPKSGQNGRKSMFARLDLQMKALNQKINRPD